MSGGTANSNTARRIRTAAAMPAMVFQVRFLIGESIMGFERHPLIQRIETSRYPIPYSGRRSKLFIRNGGNRGREEASGILL
jgi:hypothetical protein